MEELSPEYPESLVIIAWHNGDEFEFAEGMVRDGYYGISGYPTVWFDGWTPVVGGFQPSSYPYYVPVMEERAPWPSNYEVEMHIFELGGNDYDVEATVDIKNGNSTQNLAVFVVLTETALESPGSETQNWVARNVYPNGMGMPIDLSTETSFTWNTAVTMDESYLVENCEIIVFIQNMDTKEIYQATSKMATDVSYVGINEQNISNVQVYPNPATDRVNIKANSEITNVEVFNHIGQLIYTSEARSSILNISTNKFETGMYMFRIQTANGMFVESVIIE